jgi:ribonuclease J
MSWYRKPGSWLAYVPPDYTAKIEEATSGKEDENRVIALPVSHSCFPAYSFLYIGSDATIFYSGDLRLEPLINISHRLDEVMRSVGVDKVDLALIEGTNFSADHTPATASTFRDYISLMLREYELVSVSIDPLDLEAFMAILDLSMLMGRNLVIGSERLLWAIEEVEKIMPDALDKIYVSEELEIPTPLLLRNISLANEVFKDPKSYVVAIEPVGLLQIFRKLKISGETPDLTGSAVVLMDPEPRESIKEVEEGALRTWLKTFGIQAFRLRLSGHYLPHQFRNIIETIKPKEIIPIHTEEANLMIRLFQRFR